MTGLMSGSLADCMDCFAKRVACVWGMEPLFWRRCLPCHEEWEERSSWGSDA